MGASEFKTQIQGKSFSEAYRAAYKDAEEEHGSEQGYSGNMNSCDSARDITNEFKKSGLSHWKFIEQKLESCGKRDCFGICIESPKTNTNKIKTQVEHKVTSGTKKWVLNYVVRKAFCSDYIGEKPTKGAAVEIARKHTEETGERTNIFMEKSLEKGNGLVATITYKTSKEEKEGRYIFFGVAPD